MKKMPLLRLSDVPMPDAPIDEINKFARTFNAYEAFGFDGAAEIANERRQNTITEMRTCLFFEQRRWRHFGVAYDAETEMYLRSTVGRIRDLLEAAS